MRVFISCEGERSKYIAVTLSNWLEQVLQAAEPWISADIAGEERWNDEIADRIKDSKFAIICVTSDNLFSEWIHYEAGLIAKTETFVCTFLYEISLEYLESPLAHFPKIEYFKNDVLKMVKMINKKIGDNEEKSLDEKNLKSIFDNYWPQLFDKLHEVPGSPIKRKLTAKNRYILEEDLLVTRNIKNNAYPMFVDDLKKISILEFSIMRYAREYNLYYEYRTLKGHEYDCAYFIEGFPEINIIYTSRERLVMSIKEIINRLD
tara:strand:+ start:16554 stop:17339 length:786 start_codon:yes stop_codon:yes gene_type:complete